MNFNDILGFLQSYYNQPLNPVQQAGLGLAQGGQALAGQALQNQFQLGQGQLALGQTEAGNQLQEFLGQLAQTGQLGNKQLDIGQSEFGQQLALAKAAQDFNNLMAQQQLGLQVSQLPGMPGTTTGWVGNPNRNALYQPQSIFRSARTGEPISSV